VCTSVIEFAFPARNDDRCQVIADHVHTRAAHVHQFINAVAWAVWERFFSCRPKRGLAGREMDLAINMLVVAPLPCFSVRFSQAKENMTCCFGGDGQRPLNIQKLSDNR
jgi:hypothetical protein